MRFLTTVLDAEGSTVREELEAADVQELHAQLHRQGMVLVRAKPLDAEESNPLRVNSSAWAR